MDRFKRILIIMLIPLSFTYCTNGVKEDNDKQEEDSSFLSTFNKYILDTNDVNIEGMLLSIEEKEYNISLETISIYDGKSVSFRFDTLMEYTLIDPMLELSISISTDQFKINNKPICLNELNADILYDSLFSCVKNDSNRIFRKYSIGEQVFNSSGKAVFIYLTLGTSEISNIIKINWLKKLLINIIKAYEKRRNQMSISYKDLPFNKLNYSDQKAIDTIVPIKITIHIRPKV